LSFNGARFWEPPHKRWDTNFAGGGGAVTITAWTPTGASGTFSFIAAPDRTTGAAFLREVVGSFRVNY